MQAGSHDRTDCCCSFPGVGHGLREIHAVQPCQICGCHEHLFIKWMTWLKDAYDLALHPIACLLQVGQRMHHRLHCARSPRKLVASAMPSFYLGLSNLARQLVRCNVFFLLCFLFLLCLWIRLDLSSRQVVKQGLVLFHTFLILLFELLSLCTQSK